MPRTPPPPGKIFWIRTWTLNVELTLGNLTGTSGTYCTCKYKTSTCTYSSYHTTYMYQYTSTYIA